MPLRRRGAALRGGAEASCKRGAYGGAHLPSIHLNLGDTLLVDCRYEPYTRTDIGPDGTPATVETSKGYLGLISTEDFLNGVPNYTEVGEYTT